MSERPDPAALLVQHLSWIDRVSAALCRRHGLGADEAEEFASWTKAKLVEDDYAILRKFRGESALTTYLTVVVSMLYRDYRVSRWGRWRPSAAARRRGEVAVRLETLVYRDGMGYEQAAEVLRARGEARLSAGEAARILADLPYRTRGRPVQVGDEPLAAAAGPGGADERVRAQEVEAERKEAEEALRAAMQDLPAEDRVILRMRFWEGATVADIARGLALDQKPLYRRIERMLGVMRNHLQAAGISRERVRDLLAEGES